MLQIDRARRHLFHRFTLHCLSGSIYIYQIEIMDSSMFVLMPFACANNTESVPMFCARALRATLGEAPDLPTWAPL